MAPLIVSRTTGGPGAHARTGDSAHSASKTLSQRKIFPIDSFCRAMSGALSVSLYPAGRTLWTSVRDRSTFTGGKTSKPSPVFQRRNHVEKISSFLDCSRLAVLDASRLEPEPARGQGQGNCGGQVHELPCFGGACGQRVHGRGLGDRGAYDDQPRRAAVKGGGRNAHAVSGEELPGKEQGRRRGGSRARQGFDEDLEGSHAGLAAARSAGGAGRIALVHGPDGQRAGPRGSEDR